MAVLICILLAVLCTLLGLWAYTAHRGLRGAERQLRELVRTGSGTRLRMDAPNRALEDLLDGVNILLELWKAEKTASREREQSLRRQIANISHDLRTPLTSILGYLQLLENDDLPPAERREYLSVVKGRAQALQSLITSFYDLSRLEGGEYPLKKELVDLHSALSSILAAFYNDFTGRDFQVEVDLAEGLPPVTADSAGVLRVFTNLIRNALEHGRGYLEVKLFRQGESLVSRFGNLAEGVAPEDIPHVFDRFYTADKMRTGRNTGLGLAIVKALAQQMGCQVEAALEGPLFVISIWWKIS